MQGVIVAAPVYAATGSRWKAMGIATASVSLHAAAIPASTCLSTAEYSYLVSLLPQQRFVMQGLSEPLGALMALLSIKPFLTPMRLQYMLAFVGGVMVRNI